MFLVGFRALKKLALKKIAIRKSCGGKKLVMRNKSLILLLTENKYILSDIQNCTEQM